MAWSIMARPARFAVNPARPKARPLRALGVDCSARPSQFAIMPRMDTKLLAGQASGLVTIKRSSSVARNYETPAVSIFDHTRESPTLHLLTPVADFYAKLPALEAHQHAPQLVPR